MDQQAEGLIIKKKLVYLHKNQDTGFIGTVVHLLALAGQVTAENRCQIAVNSVIYTKVRPRTHAKIVGGYSILNRVSGMSRDYLHFAKSLDLCRWLSA